MRTKFCSLYLLLPVALLALARPDREFMIFQFPQNQIPRIDGDAADWAIVPPSYTIGLAELTDTKPGGGKPRNAEDFDIQVRVGWVAGLNRLYFFVEASDNFWDFSTHGHKQDLFELIVDGDLSGGPYLFLDDKGAPKRARSELYFKRHGTHAQNYHIFTPARDKDWAMVWGNTPWLKDFPHAQAAYRYDFQPGQSGRLQMEFYVTPYDEALITGPEASRISSLKENNRVGLSWACLDYDGQGSAGAFWNLSQDIRMIKDTSYLCAFRLMPIEPDLRPAVAANWRFQRDPEDARHIHFFDESVGGITQWLWDFGDGQTSTERNPRHRYTSGKEWVVVLTVEGPAGRSVRSKVWDVATP